MISAPDRRYAVTLTEQSVAAGTSAPKVRETLQISVRTYQRWSSESGVKRDGRTEAARAAPANKLSPEERQRILAICSQPEHASLSPSPIVPTLTDQGLYIASKASFYRVLREARSAAPRR